MEKEINEVAGINILAIKEEKLWNLIDQINSEKRHLYTLHFTSAERNYSYKLGFLENEEVSLEQEDAVLQLENYIGLIENPVTITSTFSIEKYQFKELNGEPEWVLE